MTERDETPRREFARTSEVADIAIRSDGDGRTVQAYITPFDTPTEIRDADGFYDETIDRSAFNRTLGIRGLNFVVLFNHGRTYDGRTDGALMVPVGAPQLIEPQDRGLYSETLYLDNPLADSVLDGIKKNAIRGYSFTGTFMRSTRLKGSLRSREKGAIHREEVAMREYGPVLFPAYADAAILGHRAQSFIDELRLLDPEDVDAFRQLLGIATPLDPATPDGTPPGPAVPAATDPASSHSPQHTTDERKRLIRARNTQKGIRHAIQAG